MSEIVEATTPNRLSRCETVRRIPRAVAGRILLSHIGCGNCRPAGHVFSAAGAAVARDGHRHRWMRRLRSFPLEGRCEMKRLYVRPAFRGDKWGELWSDCCVRPVVWLFVHAAGLASATMQAAVEMYRKLGFREVSPGPVNQWKNSSTWSCPGLRQLSVALKLRWARINLPAFRQWLLCSQPMALPHRTQTLMNIGETIRNFRLQKSMSQVTLKSAPVCCAVICRG